MIASSIGIFGQLVESARQIHQTQIERQTRIDWNIVLRLFRLHFVHSTTNYSALDQHRAIFKIEIASLQEGLPDAHFARPQSGWELPPASVRREGESLRQAEDTCRPQSESAERKPEPFEHQGPLPSGPWIEGPFILIN